jgi:hypothetical protein
MASTLNLFRSGAVGFIDWLGLDLQHTTFHVTQTPFGEYVIGFDSDGRAVLKNQITSP